MNARCLRCRGPLSEDGLCPDCDRDEAIVSEKLRKLREEIAAERGDAAPAEPRSRLWRRKRASLESARAPEASPDRPHPPDSPSEEPPAVPPGAPASASDEPTRSSSAPEVSSGASEASAGASRAPSEEPPEPSPGTSAPGAKPDAAEPPLDPAAETGVDPSPPRVLRRGSDGTLRARELDLTDARHGTEAIDELLAHRRAGLGRIIGIAGLPRHGKTELAGRLRQRFAQRPGVDLRYDKTERGEVNLYYLPGRREHHVLMDMAGEDFQALGDYDRELPLLMRRFLWPVLQEADGLMLLMALPIVWAGWNDPHHDARQEPAERDEIAMREAQQRMVDAHVMLLKYAVVAADLARLRRLLPSLGLEREQAPSRTQVDDAVPTARPLGAPVAVAFSKADLYAPGKSRSGLYTPDLPGRQGGTPPPLHPSFTDPTALAYVHFRPLFDFLLDRVRYFTFDFVQALEDHSADPDPRQADERGAAVDRLLGAEALVEFLTQHPWSFPGISTATALRIDRRLRPRRWSEDLLRRLHDRAPEGGS